MYYFGARYYDPKASIWLSVDPLAEKYPAWNPYNYTMQNPINLIDPTGMSSEDPGDPPKGNVRILINLGNAGDGDEALATRRREIIRSYPNDKIIELNVADLGKMKEQVESNLTQAKVQGFGKTVELSVWGHGGSDGPVADEKTSGPFNLRSHTGNAEDDNQMTLKGWGDINWNFNSKGSVASFYGCNTEPFAEKFLGVTNVKYSGGLGGSSGGFYNHGTGNDGEANPAWWPSSNDNVYMHSWDDKTGSIYANGYYKRGFKQVTKYGGSVYRTIYLRGNGSVNNQGMLTNGSVPKSK